MHYWKPNMSEYRGSDRLVGAHRVGLAMSSSPAAMKCAWIFIIGSSQDHFNYRSVDRWLGNCFDSIYLIGKFSIVGIVNFFGKIYFIRLNS